MDTEPVARLARNLFPGRNPLARVGDRLEGVAAVASLLVTLLGLPVAAALGSESYVRQAALSEQQLGARHQTGAVLPADSPVSAGAAGAGSAVATAGVPAEWQVPGGGARRGEVTASRDLRAGTVVRVWVDDDGAVVPAPLTAEGAVVGAVALALGAWIALGGAAALFYVLVRSVHHRLQLRRWDAGWEAVEPLWRRLA
ncbi:Rv1733c family protein [Saccharothrix syringae]|uniref:Transmembrane protein n=1 Tax=Saccharothrix syringae TaxID=103733 RepID=A0A5Q0H0M1_SACSY|nr:hypothetical protein [Saccharothrix syringae]QFZ19673.1 hypothetical protein EKG83_21565 [Saccharothrix syringae]